MILTTPNLLTLIRIALVPVLVCLLLYPGPLASSIAAALFLFGTITDFLDGYIARNYDSDSNLGKFLDPLADKLLVTTSLIMLAAISRVPRVPAWIVVAMVSREFLVTGLRAMVAVEGRVIAADELGKYKMVLQSIAIQGLLIHYTYFHIDFFAAGMFILWLALALSVWSGVDYFIDAWRVTVPRARPPLAQRIAV